MKKASGDEYQRVDRTFAFIDLSGFTSFIGSEGDGAALDVLHEFKSTVRQIAAKKGVRIAKWLGDGAMLVGTEPERTVEVVIEIEGVIDLGRSPLKLRAGIAKGPVLLVEGEDHIGDAVNLASHLCDIAKAHQVLAPASLVSSLFVNSEAEPVGDLEVSGFAEPISVVRLLPEGGLVDD